MEIAVLALGCFWGPEKKFSKIEGIVETEVGYCGGKVPGVTYKEVCSGETEHAEVVKLTFDAEKISYEKIIEYFFDFHDPTTLNRQGPDIGSQYRSEIFFYDEEQKRISLSIIEKISKKFDKKIVTQVSGIKNYTKAEEYHQKYLEKNQF
ncbi:MAG: peptide-methionine (S)-S-oxide reductase MsrA [Pseudomonadota bacterium]|nr:peptide-methionine (S)-S-oxide reductase MsrA [Candidatus Pelagibacter sp.]MEC7136736.1 peptide-methionine (S)-S-oxide reductase MsrA [Pseudomonadota bacterium]|tara:strand:- start:616 stop:1065 length:450 start_codon:yes stop_codon:yes gene_type:complete